MMRGRDLGAAFAIVLTMSGTIGAAGPDPGIVAAARRNEPGRVLDELRRGADVNARAADGSTALLWAAYYDDLTLVDKLLASGARPDISNTYEETPLSTAVQRVNPALAQRLIKAGANPLREKSSGETLLMTAARAGSPELLETLLAKGVPVDARERALGQTALMWAVSHRHQPIVRALLRAGANVNAASNRGSTPLHFAVARSDVGIAKTLLDAEADVHARMRARQFDGFTLGLVETLDNMTPLLLTIAVCRQDGPEYDGAASALVEHPVAERCPASEEIGAMLLERGADANAIDGSGVPPLHQAIRSRMPRLVGALLAHGARVNDQIPETVRQFTGQNRRGARTITPFPPGATPFFVATWAQDVPLMTALLAAGADPRRTSFDGTTPLMAAAGTVGRPAGWSRPKYNDPVQTLAAVKLSLEHGGDVASRNRAGQTALHGAARMGLNDTVQFLVDAGASLDAEDDDGYTPEQVAERADAKKTVELMNRLRTQASAR